MKIKNPLSYHAVKSAIEKVQKDFFISKTTLLKIGQELATLKSVKELFPNGG